jgi:toxic protein SymE
VIAPFPTRACTVGAGFYPEHAHRVPVLRLRGYWLEQLGFGIGCKLSITARYGELIVRVEAPTTPTAPITR